MGGDFATAAPVLVLGIIFWVVAIGIFVNFRKILVWWRKQELKDAERMRNIDRDAARSLINEREKKGQR